MPNKIPWNHPQIQEAIIEWEKAHYDCQESKKRLEVASQKLVVHLDMPDTWHGEMASVVSLWQRIFEETQQA